MPTGLLVLNSFLSVHLFQVFEVGIIYPQHKNLSYFIPKSLITTVVLIIQESSSLSLHFI
ncbi:unnamed protein product [Amoebophrya sp. A120]|nr:unnamed protein product [Amoebophrya sp. A120]|eukprot:GSA120T00018604001.1